MKAHDKVKKIQRLDVCSPPTIAVQSGTASYREKLKEIYFYLLNQVFFANNKKKAPVFPVVINFSITKSEQLFPCHLPCSQWQYNGISIIIFIFQTSKQTLTHTTSTGSAFFVLFTVVNHFFVVIHTFIKGSMIVFPYIHHRFYTTN